MTAKKIDLTVKNGFFGESFVVKGLSQLRVLLNFLVCVCQVYADVSVH